MIQPEDTKTIPLPLAPVTENRGRGRPRKEGGALTNAQRQAAYRARRKASGNPVTVTKNIPAAADGYDELVMENERLREELTQLRRDLEVSKRKARDGQRSRTSVVHEVDWVRRVVRLPLCGSEVDWVRRRRFSFTFDERAYFALDRLAVDAGISKADVVERLAFWADELMLKSFRDDVAAFNRYLYRGRNEKLDV
ncbi:hypothetical protein [Burkholderia pseudomallei]|uniref:hypothetical protein n=1 Tax=Burkholderia pseudomallei TaxID=28450 RepID=UPI00053802D5|nr:hypothetical protein [Burkholderia pseudomallei]KGW44396.1 hypothetical protein Y049_5571 [Burkholderia pseudomallei MSHR684]OMW17728.1 hypothetical protein AQ806_23285 [Burkholderia pseudomallei]